MTPTPDTLALFDEAVEHNRAGHLEVLKEI